MMQRKQPATNLLFLFCSDAEQAHRHLNGSGINCHHTFERHDSRSLDVSTRIQSIILVAGTEMRRITRWQVWRRDHLSHRSNSVMHVVWVNKLCILLMISPNKNHLINLNKRVWYLFSDKEISIPGISLHFGFHRLSCFCVVALLRFLQFIRCLLIGWLAEFCSSSC